MTRETFNKGFAMLFNAYVYAQEKTTAESEEIYWIMLREIPDGVFINAVRHCLASGKFFPTIAELGEASYPAILELAPYNSRVYHEPRKINWQEQIERRRAIEESGQKAIDSRRELEPPEVRALRK